MKEHLGIDFVHVFSTFQQIENNVKNAISFFLLAQQPSVGHALLIHEVSR